MTVGGKATVDVHKGIQSNQKPRQPRPTADHLPVIVISFYHEHRRGSLVQVKTSSSLADEDEYPALAWGHASRPVTPSVNTAVCAWSLNCSEGLGHVDLLDSGRGPSPADSVRGGGRQQAPPGLRGERDCVLLWSSRSRLTSSPAVPAPARLGRPGGGGDAWGDALPTVAPDRALLHRAAVVSHRAAAVLVVVGRTAAATGSRGGASDTGRPSAFRRPVLWPGRDAHQEPLAVVVARAMVSAIRPWFRRARRAPHRYRIQSCKIATPGTSVTS